ncbi:alpha/beta fold hydrolase [Acidiferrobacter sp. SPIII_3]|uniref:alpha/beta fold hydrolase n=1 Tax=Acidiferrobacter sp. SPIII_3 TaxID=1281578 RepID=UPI00143D56DD|nr:alpha/beta hydrolase [Acidiferrobacter sp. SPIII_3]
MFVHGLVIASRYMLPAARLLAAQTRVLAVDLPGYGRSAKPHHLLRIPELADALVEFLDANGLVRAHWVGNSFGCQIIAELAVRHPERIDRIVLQGPTVDASARRMGLQGRRLIANSRYEPASLTAISLGDYWRAGLRRAFGTARMALADRIEDKMPRIKAPTLIVRGEHDPLVPMRWARYLAGLTPHGELRVIRGWGHAVHYAAPGAFVDAVRPFLRLPS